MKSRIGWIGIGLVVALLALGGPLLATFSDDTKPEWKTPPLDAASDSVAHFFDVYLQTDGRVAGSSDAAVSSKGQSMALLLSAANNDRSRFDRIWMWTQTNLLQSNGLLVDGWHNGVVSSEASDVGANLQAARALIVASRHFNDASYDNDARRISVALLASTVTTDEALTPGEGSPRAEQELFSLTGDARWSEYTQKQQGFIDDLIGTGSSDRKLPPERAIVKGGRAMAAADSYYGANASLLAVSLTESCDDGDQKRAARIWGVLNRSRESRSATALDLNGTIREVKPSALSAVASAAAAKAGHDELQMFSLLDVADKLEADNSTMETAAVVAFGRVALTTDWLGTC